MQTNITLKPMCLKRVTLKKLGNATLQLLFLCALTFLLQPLANSTDITTKKNNSETTKPTIESLIEHDELRVQLSIEQRTPPIVKQAFIITIELSTKRWFAQGNRTQPFQLQHTVMLANNITTFNGTKRINGTTWSTQSHEITLYPLQSGKYTLPSISVNVAVNSEKHGVISGTVKTKEKDFIIELPEALIGIENYIVSSDVSLDIEGGFSSTTLENIDDDEKSADKVHNTKQSTYAIGEAVVQTFTLTAHDIPSMMLPAITTSSINNGVSIYNKPEKLFDQSNRGTVIGKRVESTTYIFEQAGQYSLPAQTIYWWNTTDKHLEKIVIPASSWIVSNATENNHSAGATNSQSLTSMDKYIIKVIIVLCIFIVAALAFWLFNRYKTTFIKTYIKLTHYEKRQIKKLFLHALFKKEYQQGSQYLYRYSLLLSNKKIALQTPCALALVQRLNQLAYSKSVHNQTVFTVKEGKTLLNALTDTVSKKSKNKHSIVNQNMKNENGHAPDIQLNDY